MQAFRPIAAAIALLALAGCANPERSRDTADPHVPAITLAQQVCANCHGVTGVSTSPNFPNLAAQSPDYLVIRSDQLTNNEAFAGAGAPFRSEAERDAMLQAYEELPVPANMGWTLRIYRKRPGNG